MALPILGLHHVTSLSSDPQVIDRFWREAIGLRRIKQTVNFDNPSVYHLYYGDVAGTPGTVMTYFPFPGLAKGSRGTGELRCVAFSIPTGSLDFWRKHLAEHGAQKVERGTWFGTNCLHFCAPDGDQFRFVEVPQDQRESGSNPNPHAIRGFESVTLTLANIDATAAILEAFGYKTVGSEENVTRFALPNGNGADFVDLEAAPNTAAAMEGAGSVHHVAFAVKDRAAQHQVREAMLSIGQRVTQVRDRDYFHAIYFRTEDGVLFEVATHEPGFDVDENQAHLGKTLKLPKQHEHLREELENTLTPLD